MASDLELIRDQVREGLLQCTCLVTALEFNENGREEFIRDGYRMVMADYPQALAALEHAVEEMLDWQACGVVITEERLARSQVEVLAILAGKPQEPDDGAMP